MHGLPVFIYRSQNHAPRQCILLVKFDFNGTPSAVRDLCTQHVEQARHRVGKCLRLGQSLLDTPTALFSITEASPDDTPTLYLHRCSERIFDFWSLYIDHNPIVCQRMSLPPGLRLIDYVRAGRL